MGRGVGSPGTYVGLKEGGIDGIKVGDDVGASVNPQGFGWEKLGSPHMFLDPPGQISGGQPALHAPHFTRAHVHTWLAEVGSGVGTGVG